MQSLWTDSVRQQKSAVKPALRGAQKAHVLIIGGGLAGILTAWRLKHMGVDAIVVEKGRVGDGTTRNTTGKITAQHGLCYHRLIKEVGVDGALNYHQLNTQAIRDYESLSETYPSDFVSDTAYVYAQTDKAKLDKELDAYQKMGLETLFLKEPPLPVETVGAVGMRNQARFNPMKLLTALADSLTVYENTFITAIEGNKAITASGSIEADHIVICTHYPFINVKGLYVLKLYQHRSYVLCLQGAPRLDGMFVDEKENGHSFRMAGDLLLVGGGDHRTGKRGGGYQELRELKALAYKDSVELFHWAAQDAMTLDGRPYIGRFSKKHAQWYVATGFNKWGMTGAMVAARVLGEMVAYGKSDCEELFNPSRSLFHRQLLLNMAHSAAGLMHFAGPRCTHMRCKLVWNGMEQSWDCPCHGSRFNAQGQVIENPAKKGMKV